MTKNSFSQKLLLVAILLISFFGMNLEEGNGQPPCPAYVTGWTQNIVTFVVNGCAYRVYICYKCSPTSSAPTEFSVAQIEPIDPNCVQSWSDHKVYTAIYNLGLSFVISTCQILPCTSNINEGSYISSYQPLCWTKLSDGTLAACGEKLCQMNYRVCRNGDGTITRTLIGQSVVGSGTECTTVIGIYDNVPLGGCVRFIDFCNP